MLNSRRPVSRPLLSRPLALCLWLGSVATVGVWGCQGPDTFLRMPVESGTGGTRNGVGGTNFGVGGRGTGGTIGTGGAGTGTGTGGAGTGTGGAAAGGSTGAGGMMMGTGGGRDGGLDAPATDVPIGTGGMMVVDANTDVEGGGTGPCAGICAPAVSFVDPPNYNSPAFMFGMSACYETVSAIRGGGCSNCAGRTNSINGTVVNGWPNPLPAPVRGGYCIQISTGTADGGAFDFASFYTYN
jgi:hypothetical protein